MKDGILSEKSIFFDEDIIYKIDINVIILNKKYFSQFYVFESKKYKKVLLRERSKYSSAVLSPAGGGRMGVGGWQGYNIPS